MINACVGSAIFDLFDTICLDADGLVGPIFDTMNFD